MAIIAGNFELAEIIKTHKESDVGELDLFCFLILFFNLPVEFRAVVRRLCDLVLSWCCLRWLAQPAACSGSLEQQDGSAFLLGPSVFSSFIQHSVCLWLLRLPKLRVSQTVSLEWV